MSKITDHFHMLPLGRVSSAGQDDVSNDSQVSNITRAFLAAQPTGRVMPPIMRVQSGREKDPKVLEDLLRKLTRYNDRAVQPVTLILVDNWPRFFRNVEAAWYNIRRFQKIGVEINCHRRWVDYADPFAKGQLGQELAHAEQVSEDISRDVKRCFSERVDNGTLPTARLPRGLKRRWITRHPKVYVIEETPAADATRRAVDLILTGSGLKAAWETCGGRAVLGSEDAFTQRLRNPLLKGEYRDTAMNMPHILTPDKFDALQRELARRAPEGRAAIEDSIFYLKGVIRCAVCGCPLTSESIKRGRHRYYTSYQVSPRHYRLPIGEPHAVFPELVEQLSLTGKAASLAAKRAVERGERERAEAERTLKAAERDLARAQAAEDNAVLLYADGKISQRQFEVVTARTRSLAAEAKAARQLLEKHGLILQTVLESLQRLSMIFTDNDPGQSNHHLTAFARMAFPSGLVFDRKNRNFRTESLNAALNLIDCTSMTTPQQKTRLLVTGDGNRVRSALPGVVRTPASDLAAFWAYVETMKKTA